MPGGRRIKCSYSGCERPEVSSRFITIEEGSSAGGQDWSSMVGSVLCTACYQRFLRGGTLERSKPLEASERRCTYKHCHSPTQSSHFYQIQQGKSSGGQDWSSVVGSVLCQACYCRFKNKGTLERSINKPLDASERRCTYNHCHSPTKGKDFFQIKEGKSAGGQDWTSVVGSVLCTACYCRFKARGTLEPRATNHIRKKHRTATHKSTTPSIQPSSSSSPRSNQDKDDEIHDEGEDEDEEEAPDTGECLICLDDSRSMCIVPCGHFGLCASCGDEGLFAGKKRPYSTCPICCEEMCEPYVMERWVWEELGGTTYET